jgi:DNA-binding IclR family transcriptional regulator
MNAEEVSAGRKPRVQATVARMSQAAPRAATPPDPSESSGSSSPQVEVVRAVSRALSLLEILSANPDGLGLVDIARRAELRLSTCHRLLTTLISLDYVVQDPETGRYLLGYKVLEMAGRSKPLHHLLIVRARPILTATMLASGETTNLAVRDGTRTRYVAQVPSRASVRMFMEIGSTTPLHATGIGKVLLAHAEQAVFDEVVQGGLAARTRRTITRVDELAAAMETIRRAGYAIDSEEFEDGVMCVAAPVRDHTGLVVAGLSVSGPSSRIRPSITRLRALVVAEATALSAALGAPPSLSAPAAANGVAIAVGSGVATHRAVASGADAAKAT